jgi:hypothetical protein
VGFFLGGEWHRMSDDIHRYLTIGTSLVLIRLMVGSIAMRRKQQVT